MKEYIRLGSTLLIICAIAAGLLALLNSATAPVIAENTKQASYAMYYEALEESDEIQDIEEEEFIAIKESYPNIQSVLTVLRGGEEFAKIFSVTSNGYGGTMENAIIFDNEHNVIAYRNISNSESPGFGNIISEESYYSRYDGKSVANSSGLILGSGGGENEIEAISGSTVTSKAVLDGLNEAISAYKEYYGNN